MLSMLSSGSSGSGPGALCVHMYVFAGVTATVSAKSASAEVGGIHSGTPSDAGASCDATPRPPRISATPVHATWNAGAVGTGQRPQVPKGGVIARNASAAAKWPTPAAT